MSPRSSSSASVTKCRTSASPATTPACRGPSMATRLPAVDVVLVGFGWTAAILAKELTDAGLLVLALERGAFRDTIPDFSPTIVQDELRYAVRDGLFEEPERETLTFRNQLTQTALPMRHLGSFRPASGAGGAG